MKTRRDELGVASASNDNRSAAAPGRGNQAARMGRFGPAEQLDARIAEVTVSIAMIDASVPVLSAAIRARDHGDARRVRRATAFASTPPRARSTRRTER